MILILKIVFIALCISIAESGDPLGNSCNKAIEKNNANKISTNINNLLSELVLKTPKTGFTTSFSGSSRAKIFGLAQCRSDVSTEDCTNCIKDAAKEIRTRCPNDVEARIWYDYCYLRYDNTSDFIGRVDTSGVYYVNVETVSDPKSFNEQLGALMERVRKGATKATSNGLGKDETKISPFLTLYGLGQCTRDLSALDCAQCLAIAVGNFPKVCPDRKGCRAIYSSCYVRYELYPFFFPLAMNNASNVGTDLSRVTIVRA